MTYIEEDVGNVRRILDEVALATAQSTVAAVESGSLQKKNTDFLMWKADFTQGGGLWLSSNRETVAIWNDSEIHRIAEMKQVEFREKLELCAAAMTRIEGRQIETNRGVLYQFIVVVVKWAADEPSTRSAKDIVDRFLYELSGGALEWTGKIWLSGINAADMPIQIKDGITLRRPESGDFSRRVPADYGFDSRPSTPDSILECSFVVPEPPDLRPVINALSLFRAAPVKPYLHHWTSNSLLRSDTLSYDLAKPSSPALPSPELSTSEGEKLRAFVQAISEKLPLNPLGYHSDATWNGLKFYFRALHTASDVEERLALAVASLETSLLSDNPRDQIAYRLSQRAAALLRFAGFMPRSIFDEMKRAYKFRSLYAHGTGIKVGDLDTVTDLCPRILDYARLVVIKFFGASHGERTATLTALDSSLLDDHVRADLEQKLRGGLWDYVIG